MRTRPAVRRWVTAVAAVGLSAMAACTGASEEERDPAEVLQAAADRLTGTSGVRLVLSTDGLPSGVSGLTGANGEVGEGAGFEGTLTVRIASNDFEVPVVSVDGTVWAQLPFTTGWSDIDPQEYGAPDPARLVGAERGLPSLLSATIDPQAGEARRGGQDNSEVLTTYTGTVPGEQMERVLPSSSGDSFEATYLVTEDDELRQAELTGVFYPDSEEMTYRMTVEDYDIEVQVTAPE